MNEAKYALISGLVLHGIITVEGCKDGDLRVILVVTLLGTNYSKG